MADNTKQMRWIVVLFGNLSALFAGRKDVFIAGDLLWYPVEGQPEINNAPDVLVVFGRPPGDRGSYKQWEEDNIPLTVVFEILSPSNSVLEMDDKRDFYEEYGVEEYYLYDPTTNRLKVWVRRGEVFRQVRPADGFVSPRLGVRFDLSGAEMVVWGPDGQRFLTFEQLQAARKQAEQRGTRLAELGRKACRGQATAEELAELDRWKRGLRPPRSLPWRGHPQLDTFVDTPGGSLCTQVGGGGAPGGASWGTRI
jgi:Uma2 family endonuclease